MNMKKLGMAILATGMLLGLTGTASATSIPAVWEDSMSFSVKLSDCGSLLCELFTEDGFGYTHDISDGANGYRPGLDTIENAWVRIYMKDDSDTAAESADVNIAPLLMLGGLGGGGTYTDFSVGFQNFNVNLLGRLDLAADGKLSIYIEPTKGDFVLTGSLLHASGTKYVTSVPEPGTLALLAFGLIGTGFALRRRSIQIKPFTS